MFGRRRAVRYVGPSCSGGFERKRRDECDFEGEIDEYTEDGDYYVCPVCDHKNQFNVEEPDYYTYESR